MSIASHFFDYSCADLAKYLLGVGGKAFNAKQVFKWVYKRSILNPVDWSDLSKLIRENWQLDMSLPKILWSGVSKDGTKKFLVGFADKQSVETVIIPGKNRFTICLSTQVGCAIGCTFCHTGTMGLKRNLTAGEIVGQFMAVQLWLNQNYHGEVISNIVYMGQGEPLHNFENVKKATQIFLEDNGLGLSQRKITLSTSGLIPQIKKLHEFPPVNIAISLHAAHSNIRSELMPINKSNDLMRLLEAIKEIPLKAHRWITYEYILIKDLNDRQEDIDALIALLNKKESKINIIPFNEYPNSKFKRPSNTRLHWFNDQLNARGIVSTIRATKGQDILAACGQLKSDMDQLNLWERNDSAHATMVL